MFWTVLGNALLIFALRLIDVSMGTVRMMMVNRGMRKIAALIGFVEVSIWVLAISRVITNLDNIWNVIGYSGGFAAGTLLGMWIEDKLAIGTSQIEIISLTKCDQILEAIRDAGYGATKIQGQGQSGPAHVIRVITPRKGVQALLREVNKVDAKAFITVEDIRQMIGGYRRLAK
jgi:uncharacterized protein YebE (UPF0316 family)